MDRFDIEYRCILVSNYDYIIGNCI